MILAYLSVYGSMLWSILPLTDIVTILNQWPEVDSLVKALQEIDGIQTVNKGRFFFSPGLAPTFQVSSCRFQHL